MSKMRVRYFVLMFFKIAFCFFSWYYASVFCGIYVETSYSWIYGVIISLITYFIIAQLILFPLWLITLKGLAKCTKSRYVLY